VEYKTFIRHNGKMTVQTLHKDTVVSPGFVARRGKAGN